MPITVKTYKNSVHLGFSSINGLADLSNALRYYAPTDTTSSSFTKSANYSVYQRTWTFTGEDLVWDTSSHIPKLVSGTITDMDLTVYIPVVDSTYKSYSISGLEIDAADIAGGSTLDYWEVQTLYLSDGVIYESPKGVVSEYLHVESNSNEIYAEKAYSGNDKLTLGTPDESRNNTVYVMSGNDKVIGSGGADNVYGGKGNDILNGKGGLDKLYGDEGRDILRGNGGDDWLYGGSGKDKIFGGGGDDAVYGGAGDDIIKGGNGADVFVFADGDGDDVLKGYTAEDRIDVNSANVVTKAVVEHGVLVEWGTDSLLVKGYDDVTDVMIV